MFVCCLCVRETVFVCVSVSLVYVYNAIACMYMCTYVCVYNNKNITHKQTDSILTASERTARDDKDHCIALCLFFLYLLYPTLSAKLLTVFDCVEVAVFVSIIGTTVIMLIVIIVIIIIIVICIMMMTVLSTDIVTTRVIIIIIPTIITNSIPRRHKHTLPIATNMFCLSPITTTTSMTIITIISTRIIMIIMLLITLTITLLQSSPNLTHTPTPSTTSSAQHHRRPPYRHQWILLHTHFLDVIIQKDNQTENKGEDAYKDEIGVEVCGEDAGGGGEIDEIEADDFEGGEEAFVGGRPV